MGPRNLLRAFIATTMLIVLCGVTASPATAEGGRRNRPRVPGMVIVESNRSFDDTWSSLITALEANTSIRVVAKIDHSAAAKSAGLALDPNRVVVFGNPNLGTPLMRTNQVAGLDLPQKIQVFEQKGRVWVGFNDVLYLKARHRLGAQPTLETIDGALRALAGVATGTTVDARSFSSHQFKRWPGIVTVSSDADVDVTWKRLLAAIDASPANVAFTVDHQAGAKSVGLELRPTRLVVFGNPQLGTPLMRERPTAGIDLPLKILVWEDESGRTFVSTNNERLARRHRLRRADLDPLATAVNNFLTIATTTP